jgi:hypothetical protein
VAPTVSWNERFWGTTLFRSGGIFGAGLGGEIYDGIILSYSSNLSTSINMNTFNSHQLSLGVRIFKFLNNSTIKE